ncbi:MAG: peptidylprolyl isomerase, partial [Gemmatimonadales bacterium]|nr:peptidylprolyl isomerase [Gemmatimonadales bacterium]
MRRVATLSLLALTSLLGCASLRDVFTAHANEAARAGTFTLGAEQLATILKAAGPQAQTTDVAVYIAETWVDYALYAQAVARRLPLTDSATMTAAFWPELGQLKVQRLHDDMLKKNVQVGPGAIDSAYDGPDVRVIQHILIGVQATAPEAQKAAARKQAEDVLRQVRAGTPATFADLARKLSQDPGSGRDGGFLPPAKKGAYVPAFDAMAWKLGPGEISAVVPTEFGFHVLRRPTKEEAAPRLAEWVRQAASQKLDSAWVAGIASRNGVEVRASAPQAMRTALARSTDYASNTLLVAAKGKGLTVGDFNRWLRALPPDYAQQLKAAPDSMLRDFAKSLAVQQLMAREADSLKLGPTPEEWTSLRARYAQELEALSAAMGLASGPVADTSAAAEARTKAAEQALTTYFTAVTTGQAQLRPMPSQLAIALRAQISAQVNDAGIKRALELARPAPARGDSAKAGAAPAPDGAFQPAPGGPPVGTPAELSPGPSFHAIASTAGTYAPVFAGGRKPPSRPLPGSCESLRARSA